MQLYMNEYGEPQYDWVSAHGNRTPREFPYSFDPYYIWRDFDKTDIPDGVDSIYMDRMRNWDPDAYSKAIKAVDGMNRMSKQFADTFIDTFYNGRYKCVGHALACNVSTGYEIPIFFIKGK